MCASHGQLECELHLLVPFETFFATLMKSGHACTAALECTHISLKAWMDVCLSADFLPYCVLLLCLPRFSPQPRELGFQYELMLLLQLLPTFRGKQQEDRGEESQWGFDPPLGQSSMDCKAGFPLRVVSSVATRRLLVAAAQEINKKKRNRENQSQRTSTLSEP